MQQYLTHTFPGTGGEIKHTPEDFYVEEIPAYLPSGSGDHLYLWVEKRNCSTMHVVQQLIQRLKIKNRDIGYAGLKDNRATTRQWFSVDGSDEATLHALELGPDIQILKIQRHTNKLRLGHLHGNRFKIKIRGVEPTASARALDIIHALQHTGIPNFFGPQRYGSRGNNHIIGKAILRADFDAALHEIIGDPATITNQHWHAAAVAFKHGDLEQAIRVMPRRMRDERRLLQALRGGASAKKAVLSINKNILRLYLSAYQSEVFDRQVQMRLDSLDVLLPGDIAYIHASGACFRVEDPQQEQKRADQLDISPTGLLPGKKAMLAQGQTGILEAALLDKEGLTDAQYGALNGLQLSAERRPLRVHAPGLNCTAPEDGSLQVEFALPAGSYATSLIREIVKSA
ncbi:MAG: tRNA pseudouridine(13) synthase TruD [Desulfuromonadaceae bacterium]|nr:tRNA pseudouridine(13) synthase TruD [Desulfuromonadaceae bacterium]